MLWFLVSTASNLSSEYPDYVPHVFRLLVTSMSCCAIGVSSRCSGFCGFPLINQAMNLTALLLTLNKEKIKHEREKHENKINNQLCLKYKTKDTLGQCHGETRDTLINCN
jgi:hypothetical protein